VIRTWSTLYNWRNRGGKPIVEVAIRETDYSPVTRFRRCFFAVPFSLFFFLFFFFSASLLSSRVRSSVSRNVGRSTLKFWKKPTDRSIPFLFRETKFVVLRKHLARQFRNGIAGHKVSQSRLSVQSGQGKRYRDRILFDCSIRVRFHLSITKPGAFFYKHALRLET
jgi:hypothetical protein